MSKTRRSGRDGARPRVLVLEDDQDTREFLRDLLHVSGFDSDVAADADGARALLGAEPPDLLVVDLSLPRESGLRFLRELRERGIDTPALLVTAHPTKAGELGDLVAGLVRKPFVADELIGAISRTLARAAR